MGSRAGAGGRPVSVSGVLLLEMSAISTNSKSRIRLTSFGGSEVVGLNGPWDWMDDSRLGTMGVHPVAALVHVAVEAAAASMSSPELPGIGIENTCR